MPTPYEILGIKRGASTDEIRRAYKLQLLKTHPDKGGDRDKLAAVQKAYAELTAPEPPAYAFSYASSSPQSTASDAEALRVELLRQEAKKPAMPNDWDSEFFKKGRTFKHYAATILAMQDSETSSTTILHQLFILFLQPELLLSRLKFWHFNRPHVALVSQLKLILENPESHKQSADEEMPIGLILVFEAITATVEPLNAPDEFVGIFNTFFAIFPNYFALLDDSNKLKKHIHLTLLDDVLPTTIFRKYTRDRIYSDRTPMFDRARASLINFTGELTVAIQNNIERYNLTRDFDRYQPIVNLAALTEYASAAVIENIVLPFTLTVLGHTEMEARAYGELNKVLRKAIQTINPIYVEKQILSTLLKHQHLQADKEFPDMLAEVALRLANERAEKEIFPLLVNLITAESRDSEGRKKQSQKYFKAIIKILHLISPESIQALLALQLHEHVSIRLSSAHEEVFEIYALLQQFERAAGIPEKRKWAEIIDLVQPVIEKEVRNGTLSSHTYKVQSSAEIKNTVTHILNYYAKPDHVYFKETSLGFNHTVYESELRAFSKLPEDKLSSSDKNAIFEMLYAMSPENFIPGYINVIKEYFPYAINLSKLTDLGERLLAYVDFVTFNISPIYESAMAALVNYLTPEFLQNKLVPYVLSNDLLNSKNSNRAVKPFFENLMARVPTECAMQSIVPKLMKELRENDFRSPDLAAAILLPLIPRLPYEYCLTLKLQLLNFMKSARFTVYLEAPLLVVQAITQHQQQVLLACKPHIAATKEPQLVVIH